MQAEVSSAPPTKIPRQSQLVKRIVDPVYRSFDYLYGSEFNPLYRSGTLAVALLFVLLVTGLYLSLFYSVGNPHESLVRIQEQIWFGRWIRALHRYATVATLITIVFHILQLLAQGKTWGPRTLAWLSGVLLTGLFFFSAWSGYVMVWDLHGQRVALAGATILAELPLLRGVITAAFDGTREIPPGFFFMNLFLHVALPLGMIIALWIHTSRLSRAVWLPAQRMLVWTIIGLVALSIAWPAPLLEKADLLRVVGRIPTDVASGFWMSFDAMATVVFGCGLVGTLLAIPWWWKVPLKERRATSQVDGDACTGCTQCTRDCPYEAIQMVPRSDGKRLIAEVIPEHCVSCGVCAASCADFAIGPPGRTAIDQRTRVMEFCRSRAQGERLTMVLVACANNGGLHDLLHAYELRDPKIVVYPVECCGCVHSEVIEQLLEVSAGCVLIGCPARNCFNRDGGELLSQRVYEKRIPFLDRSIDRSRILIAAYSEAEAEEVECALDTFSKQLEDGARSRPQRPAPVLRPATATMTSIVLLALCAYAGQAPLGADPTHGVIRVAGTLSSSSAESCRVPNEEDLKGLPVHMQPKQVCNRTPRTYRVSLIVDQQVLVDHALRNENGRIDQPLFLDLEGFVSPGPHALRVSIEDESGVHASCDASIDLQAGEIFLAHYQRETEQLFCGWGKARGVAALAAAS